MKYNEASEYMESLSAGKILPKQDFDKKIYERLGNPQRDLTFVHIESGFGRESVPAYVCTVLKCAGYQVGRYVTTDVYEYREHFQVGGKPITKKGFCELAEKCREICDSITTAGDPPPASATVEAAMAFWYFRQQECDIVIVDDKNRQIEDCKIDSSPAGKKKYGLEKQRFDYKEWKNLEISQAGVYQIQNAILAIEALQNLQKQGYNIPEKTLRKGLLETSCPGQFAVLGKKPYFVADTVSSIKHAVHLTQSLEVYFAGKRRIFIMGMIRDAEYEQMIELIHKNADWIITVTSPGNDRTLGSYELAAEVAKIHTNVTAVDSPEEAVEISRLLAGKEDVIVALGPVSLIGRFAQMAKNGKL